MDAFEPEVAGPLLRTARLRLGLSETKSSDVVGRVGVMPPGSDRGRRAISW